MTSYAEEILDSEDDDGTMVDSRYNLERAVVGHRIVSVERLGNPGKYYGDLPNDMVLTLDNGNKVKIRGEYDCCAFTEVEAFLLHPELVDHIIMGVGTTDNYTTWHIYADMGDVLELTVGWSPGNPFYYGYGFSIEVEKWSELS